MLCQFSVKNFKSFRDEATFDMQAASISEHSERILVCEDGEAFLPISSIYGPNGGGKSNILEALMVMRLLVLTPILTIKGEENSSDLKLPRVAPFKFSNKSKDEVTEFCVFFRTGLSEYRYVLYVKGNSVEYERLDRRKYETHRNSLLFERDQNSTDYGDELVKLKVSKDLSKTIPLISYLGITYSENDVVKDVLGWFENGINVINYGSPLAERRVAISREGHTKNLVLQMIREMDLDITGYRVDDDGDRVDVYTTHTIDGKEIELELREESSGTKKVFGLLPYVADCLIEGSTLVVDELDAKVHPVLLKYLIQLFTSKDVNRKGAQLIFTSHDLSTMTGELFRRDEIWFVAKGEQEESVLYSLVEFKSKDGSSVRKDAKYGKQYLEGKYGADPYLKRIIEWSEV